MRRSLPVLLSLVLVAGLGCPAPAVDEPGHDHPSWTAPGFELSVTSGRWLEIDRLTAESPEGAWAGFADVLGPGWLMTPGATFGSPRCILGPGWFSGMAPLSPEEAVRVSRDLLRRLAKPLGVDDAGAMELRINAVVRNPYGHQLIGIDFLQTHAGHAVRTMLEPSRVYFRYNLTLGKLVMLGSTTHAGLRVATDSRLGRGPAEHLARDLVPAYAPGTGRIARFDTFVLVGMNEQGDRVARLAYEVDIHVTAPHHDWRVVIDARTGERLHVSDSTCYTDVIGNVSIGSLDEGGGTPPAVKFSVKPAVDLFVAVTGGGTGQTDSKGNFKITHAGTSPVTVTGRLAGAWCTVTNRAGGNLSFSQSATPGAGVNIVMNGKHTSELITAETTAYDWVNRVHYFVAKRITNFTALAKMGTDVNINSNCNAYYSTSTRKIHFYTSGGGCSNTSFAEVVAHEWGHGFHHWFSGGISNRGLSEGIADHLGLYLTDQRVMGRGFRTNGSVVRDYRVGGAANLTLWPKQGGSGHRDGQIWAGTLMDMRDYLVTKMGVTAGKNHSEMISIPQYSIHKPPTMPDGIKAVMLLDDNDANLLNGTPNFAQIAAAADRHKLPRPPDPKIVQFAHTPLPNSRDVVNDYVVASKITSSESTITKATLTYTINGGAPKTVPLVKGAADMFAFPIPAQPAVARVEYYLEATDGKSNSARSPKVGTYGFTVGHENLFFTDDFETDKGWARGNDDTATTGWFERADPVANKTGGYVSQPEDDHTAGAGTMCWVTQNGRTGQLSYTNDVDNGQTSVVSPRLDLSKVTGNTAKLEFAYWFVDHMKNNDALTVEVSLDDGKAWKSFFSLTTSDTQWHVMKDLTIPGQYSATMRIRFKTSDLPDDSLVDLLIDDVRILTVDDNVAALRAQTHAPTPGTTLNYSITAPREPNAAYLFAWSIGLAPTELPGLGVMDLALPIYPLIIGSTGATGTDNFQIPLPSDSALKGITFHTQTLVTGKASIFSNVWSFTVK